MPSTTSSSGILTNTNFGSSPGLHNTIVSTQPHYNLLALFLEVTTSVIGDNWKLSTGEENVLTFILWCELNSFQSTPIIETCLHLCYPVIHHVSSNIQFLASRPPNQISTTNKITISGPSCDISSTWWLSLSLSKRCVCSPVPTTSLSIILFHWFFWWVSGMVRCPVTKCCTLHDWLP